MDRSFCAWTVFFALGLAALFGAGAAVTWKTYLSGTPDPVDTPLADVTPDGAGGNVHVRIRDMEFGIEYIPSVNDKTGLWRSVLVPLLSGGRVRAMLQSDHVADGWQLQALKQRPVLTGVVSHLRPSLNAEETARLAARYPGVDFSALPLIDEGREFPTALEAWTMTAVAAVGTFWAGLAGRLWWVAGRPKPVSAEDASPAGRLRAAGLPLAEGLGQLREVYSIGSKRSMVFEAATFPLLLGGFLVGMLAMLGPKEYWFFAIFGTIEFGLLVLFYFVVTNRGHMGALYDDGLVSHEGTKMTACRWEEVESATGLLRVEVTINIKGETITSYAPRPLRLCCPGGKEVIVGAVEREMELVEAVRHEVVRRQLPRALEALRKGEKILVGPLELDRNGITGPRDCWVAWDGLGEVWSGDKLVIQENGLTAPLWSGKLNIPNAALLVELAEAAKRGEIR